MNSEREPKSLGGRPDSQSKSDDVEKKRAREHLEVGREIFTPFINAYAERVSGATERLEEIEVPEPLQSPNVDELLSNQDYLDAVYSGDAPCYLAYEPIEEVEEYVRRTVGLARDSQEVLQEITESYLEEISKYRSAIEESGLQEVLDSLDSGQKKNYLRLIDSIKRNAVMYSTAARQEARDKSDSERGFAELLPVASHESFLWGKQVTAKSNQLATTLTAVVVPIGPYGLDLAEKLYNTAQKLIGISQQMNEESRLMSHAYQAYLNETARGSDSVGGLPEEVPLEMLREGIQSLTSALVLMSSERYEGFDDADALVEALIVQGMPSRVARSVPSGMINPIVNLGKYIPGFLQYGEGQFHINPELEKRIFIPWKEFFRTSDEEIRTRRRMPAAGRGCPVAFKGSSYKESGIDCLSAAFLHVYNQQ